MMNKILLVGYYGKGNFGDDILFIVTYNLVKKWKPYSKISVRCDDYREDYLSKLVNEQVFIVSSGYKEEFDYIIHGGGGTFFDFTEGKWQDRLINTSIRFLGFKYYKILHDFLRKILNKELIVPKKRYGFGIGVGTYTKNSKKLKYNIPTLLDFDFLMLRDSQSRQNLLEMGVDIPLCLGTDLAFLDDYWVPSNLNKEHVKNKVKKLGIILRDWDDTQYMNHIRTMLESLAEKYELHIFIFDRREDKKMIELSHGYKSTIWNPMEMTLKNYCEQLVMQDMLVTTRAHGAICGAVLGIPSILIEIEPKLKTIHELLPDSTILYDIEEIDKVVINSLIYDNMILDDVKKNRKIVNNLIQSILYESNENV